MNPFGKITFVKETPTYSSVVIVNRAYLQAPDGYYFDVPFSITSWVYVINVTGSSRVIDFGNSGGFQEVILAYARMNTRNIFFKVYGGVSGSATKGTLFPSSPVIGLNNWFHLTATIHQNNTACLYYNGTLVTQSIWTNDTVKFWRTRNYVGRSNFGAGDGPAQARFRNLRFYSKALNQSEIQNDMFF